MIEVAIHSVAMRLARAERQFALHPSPLNQARLAIARRERAAVKIREKQFLNACAGPSET